MKDMRNVTNYCTCGVWQLTIEGDANAQEKHWQLSKREKITGIFNEFEHDYSVNINLNILIQGKKFSS
jgi:hypothetical protein